MKLELASIHEHCPVFRLQSPETRYVTLIHSRWSLSVSDPTVKHLSPENLRIGDSCFMAKLSPAVAGFDWVKFDRMAHLMAFLEENL